MSPQLRTDALRSFAGALALGAFLSLPAQAGVVSIMPSTLDIVCEPGDDFTTTIRIHYGQDGPHDTQPARILLTTEDWDMNEAGELSFDDSDPTLPGASGMAGADETGHFSNSARDWIVFSPGEAEVQPGESLTVRLSVIVPEDAVRGEYRAALIAQPRAPYRPQEAGSRRLELLCRLASIIYVTVPPVSDSIELNDLRVAQRDDRLEVVPQFLNTGEATVRVFDSYEILPIDVSEFAVDCYREKQESGVVLPGRRCELAGLLPCDLPAGQYSLIYTADVGEDRPLLQGETTFFVGGEDVPVASVDEPAAGETNAADTNPSDTGAAITP